MRHKHFTLTEDLLDTVEALIDDYDHCDGAASDLDELIEVAREQAAQLREMLDD